MSLESDNSKKLKNFFGKEYQSLKIFVQTKIKDTASRDAEDIIQDVALKLFSGADRYGPINNVAGFVYRSVKNKIIDVLRTKKRESPVEIESEFLNLTDIMQQGAVGLPSEEMTLMLKKTIQNLKPNYRDIIIAVDIEGYSYKEISMETGIPEGTLMSRRHRAIGILFRKLKSENKKYKNA